MRLREREMPLDPEVERELEAIDRAARRRAGRPRPRGARRAGPGAARRAAGRGARLRGRARPAGRGRIPAARSACRVPPAGGAAEEADRRAAAPDPGPRPEPRPRCWWSPAWRSARAARSGAVATAGASARGRRRTSPRRCRRTSQRGGGAGRRRCGRASDGGPRGDALAAGDGGLARERSRIEPQRSARLRGDAASDTRRRRPPRPSARSPGASTWRCRPRRSASGPRPTASSTWSATTAATSCARASPGAIPTRRGRGSATRASRFGSPPGSCPPPWATSPTSATSSREPTGEWTSRAGSCPPRSGSPR